MAERARNLRKMLSKKRVDKKEEPKIEEEKQIEVEDKKEEEEKEDEPEEIEEVEEVEDINTEEVEIPIYKTRTEVNIGMNTDIDPLNYLESVHEEEKKNEPINPLSFFDLLNNANAEKKKKKEGLNQNSNNNDGTKQGKSSSVDKKMPKKNKKVAKINKLIERIKKKKEENPPRLLGSLAKHNEQVIIRQIRTEVKESETEPELNLPEMDEKKKQRLLTRMATAKQGLSKMSFAKALLKRTSEAILQKAKNFENQMGLESLKEVNDLLSKEYILKDNDVQQIKEGEVISTPVANKNIDIANFMGPKGGEKKSKKNIADLLLGKNRKKNVEKKEEDKGKKEGEPEKKA